MQSMGKAEVEQHPGSNVQALVREKVELAMVL
jgi:hypothetical protein